MSDFSCDPSKYTIHRPQYPDQLFQYLKELSNDSKIVLECGAGSGQASIGLSRHFDRLIAIDASFELISQASQSPNILYLQSSAEQLPIKSSSVSLICTAQAMHWFNLDKFYNEVRRVIKPGGIIAAWCYNKSTIDVEIDKVIDELYEKISNRDLQSIQRGYVHENYQTIPFPFQRISTPSFSMYSNWDMFQYLGYINTWPGVIEYQKKNNIDLVSEISEELRILWGDVDKAKLISWSIHLLLGYVV